MPWGHNDISQAWVFSGTALRILQDLELQHDPERYAVDLASDRLAKRESHRRLYRGCYANDKLFSLFLGRQTLEHVRRGCKRSRYLLPHHRFQYSTIPSKPIKSHPQQFRVLLEPTFGLARISRLDPFKPHENHILQQRVCLDDPCKKRRATASSCFTAVTKATAHVRLRGHLAINVLSLAPKGGLQ